MLEENRKLLKENRQIMEVFKESKFTTKFCINLLDLNLRCTAVVELHVVMMKKKKRSAARLAYKSIFTSSVMHQSTSSRANPGHFTIFCAREWGI